MTSRERLLGAFNEGDIDRTPITVFISDTDISDGLADTVIKTRTEDRISDLIKFHEILDIDTMLRVSSDIYEPLAFDRESESWKNVWEPLSGGKYLIHRIITPEGEIKEVFNTEGEDFHGNSCVKNWMKLRNVRIEALVKTAGDLKLIKKYRPLIQPYCLEHISQIKNRLGNKGIILPRASSSVFSYAAGLLKLEDLLVAPLMQAEFYHELMDFCMQDVIAVSQKVLDSGGDVVRIIGNMANCGIMSDKYYLDHVLPFEKQLIDFVTSRGGKILFHNCGKSSSLLKIYREMLGGHALESLSTASTGGDINSLADARKLLGDHVVMVGNFDQVGLLRYGTKEQIRERVRQIFDETRGDRKFIFSTSDSFVPQTPYENIKIMIEAAREEAAK